MIAGLEDINDGQIDFENVCVNDIEPAHRGAAMVFQSYALYPHMTVAENMGFSLKMAGIKKETREAAVRTAAQTLQIEHLLERKPKALSGGQRQRVAIGRAIVRKPKVFLFDEPLSNLDANLRVQMRVELTRLHHEIKTTMIYVTHDQTEAMTLGERIAVFNQGKVEQVGAPMELYNNPANVFVAEFMGSTRINLFPVIVSSDHASQLSTQLRVANAGQLQVDQPLTGAVSTVGIRPENLRISTNGSGDGSGLRATVSLIENLGDSAVVYFRVDGLDKEFALKTQGVVEGLALGTQVTVNAPASALLLFDAHGNRVRQ
jgi:multiple sugar transport system ATP-binding protein